MMNFKEAIPDFLKAIELICNTRSIFTCEAGLRSPISSRKMVPPWATSKRPLRILLGVGERALARDRTSRSRTARDEMPPRFTFTKRPACSPTVTVDRFGDQLLPRAALTGDQDRGVSRGSGPTN